MCRWRMSLAMGVVHWMVWNSISNVGCTSIYQIGTLFGGEGWIVSVDCTLCPVHIPFVDTIEQIGVQVEIVTVKAILSCSKCVLNLNMQ